MYLLNIAASVMGVMIIFFTGQLSLAAQLGSIPAQLPVKDQVTMIDLGANKCIPCKMMAPILKELEAKYRGRAAIVFIDVWENKGMDQKFGIRTIPTQIFYDHTGKEVYRHEGFLDRNYIIDIFMKLGVPLEAGAPQAAVMPAAAPQPVQGAVPTQPAAGTAPAQVQPYVVNNAPVPPAPGAPAGGMATGLLTPGSVNLLFLDINVSQPKEQVFQVFGALEKAYPKKVTLLLLDANTNQDIIRNLGIRAVPTLVVYDPSGREAARYPGMPALPEIQALLAKMSLQ